MSFSGSDDTPICDVCNKWFVYDAIVPWPLPGADRQPPRELFVICQECVQNLILEGTRGPARKLAYESACRWQENQRCSAAPRRPSGMSTGASRTSPGTSGTRVTTPRQPGAASRRTRWPLSSGASWTAWKRSPDAASQARGTGAPGWRAACAGRDERPAPRPRPPRRPAGAPPAPW
jgi:hypothetical protein